MNGEETVEIGAYLRRDSRRRADIEARPARFAAGVARRLGAAIVRGELTFGPKSYLLIRWRTTIEIWISLLR